VFDLAYIFDALYRHLSTLVGEAASVVNARVVTHLDLEEPASFHLLHALVVESAFDTSDFSPPRKRGVCPTDEIGLT
jgi:hypothetical protein